MARLDDLKTLRADLIARMGECESDQNYAVLGRLLADVLKQLEEVEKAQPAQKGTALDEFTRRRSERQASSPKGAARSK